jgi:hypothetical protein
MNILEQEQSNDALKMRKMKNDIKSLKKQIHNCEMQMKKHIRSLRKVRFNGKYSQ